jgi:hypothetical protein
MSHSPSSEPPRLEHEQALACHPRLIEQDKGHHRALACSRRRLEDNRLIRSERARQLWKSLIDR